MGGKSAKQNAQTGQQNGYWPYANLFSNHNGYGLAPFFGQGMFGQGMGCGYGGISPLAFPFQGGMGGGYGGYGGYGGFGGLGGLGGLGGYGGYGGFGGLGGLGGGIGNLGTGATAYQTKGTLKLTDVASKAKMNLKW